MKMQPYPNPNYYSQYMQPQYNPYLQRMENLQQFQQTIQPMQNQISNMGKMVESIDMVKVADIPMDGNVYYFPKADGTEIYSKQFMPNGQTRILTFKPSLDEQSNNSADTDIKTKITLSDEVTEVFMKRFDDLEKRFDELTAKKPATNRAKKESSEDE